MVRGAWCSVLDEPAKRMSNERRRACVLRIPFSPSSRFSPLSLSLGIPGIGNILSDLRAVHRGLGIYVRG